jgi:voltage-gated potassium channel
MDLTSTLSKYTKRRLVLATIVVFLMLVVGAIGFHILEGWGWLESLYVAAQTVTTVGYGDMTPVTRAGRVFTIVFVLVGVGTVLYALTLLAQSIIQSEILEAMGSRRKIKEMDKLKDHYIVCGAGRVGRRVIRQLQKEKLPCVIIELDEKRVAEFENDGLPIIVADATLEETLLKAGVQRAKGLASCLAQDALNVYVVLTARGLNEKLHIVARAVEAEAEVKLVRAGASRVISPIIIGSQSMARALLKPAIADFMESIVAESLDLVFEEVAIGERSPYNGKQLRETNISDELNIIVVAVRRRGGDMIFHPAGDTQIKDHDLLIVVGNAEQVKKLIEVNQ